MRSHEPRCGECAQCHKTCASCLSHPLSSHQQVDATLVPPWTLPSGIFSCKSRCLSSEICPDLFFHNSSLGIRMLLWKSSSQSDSSWYGASLPSPVKTCTSHILDLYSNNVQYNSSVQLSSVQFRQQQSRQQRSRQQQSRQQSRQQQSRQQSRHQSSANSNRADNNREARVPERSLP